jgi:hypothetical protein
MLGSDGTVSGTPTGRLVSVLRDGY